MGYKVNKKKIYDFIDNGLKDKDYHLQTTSKKFKKDMVDFFDFPEARDFRCLELGFWRGYTSVILAQIFGHVTSVDINDGSKITKESEKFSNLEYLYPYDVYLNRLNPSEVPVIWKDVLKNKTFNVFFIDCVHDYAHFHSDIQRSIAVSDISQPVYFIVDDYGTSISDNRAESWDGSINLYVKENLLKANKGMSIVARLGLSEGDIYHEERKPLRDSEGVIIKWEI